jgi:DNA invertase Pin-like site-specific DNA recombinase
VTYRRVSRQSQGIDGLGMAAQEKLLADYIAKHDAAVVGSFQEVRSGLKERPALKKAIAKARATRSILLCAKVDRIGRRASEVLTLLDQSRVRVVFADMENASDLQLGIMAVVAQEEARAISVRTKAALAVAAEKGIKLGGPKGAEPLVKHIEEHGNVAAVAGAKRNADRFARDARDFIEPLIGKKTDKEIAEALNAPLDQGGIETRRVGCRWHATSVRRLRLRIQKMPAAA